MNLSWNRLRSLNNSQNNAFEEVCCQLAAYEVVPLGSRFTRKGRPDGGVECFWQFPDGSEWAWQAKFVTSLGNTQWREVDDSVKAALRAHSPNLKRYTVCFPFDFPDARVAGQKSLKAKWDERVKKWQGWATNAGLSVEFDYWGEHHIWERLSRVEHRGRLFFWFNHEYFDMTWLKHRIDEAVENARDRYTPALHVPLPIAGIFDGLGRTTAFCDLLKKRIGEIRELHRKASFEFEEPEIKNKYAALAEQVQRLFLQLQTASPIETQPINFAGIAILASEASETAWEAERLLQDKVATNRRKPNADQQASNYSYRRHNVFELAHRLSELEYFVKEPQCQLVNAPALLLTSIAGNGKTHLLCDIAKERIANELPTLLLLGEAFSNAEPWSQIIGRLGLNCSREELPGTLQAAAQAAGSRALILIDALNEGEGETLWARELPGFLATLARYPEIGIAVSVRSSYEKALVPNGLVPQKLIRVEHKGFAGREEEAATKFFLRCSFWQRVYTLIGCPVFGKHHSFIGTVFLSIFTSLLSLSPSRLTAYTAAYSTSLSQSPESQISNQHVR